MVGREGRAFMMSVRVNRLRLAVLQALCVDNLRGARGHGCGGCCVSIGVVRAEGADTCSTLQQRRLCYQDSAETPYYRGRRGLARQLCPLARRLL